MMKSQAPDNHNPKTYRAFTSGETMSKHCNLLLIFFSFVLFSIIHIDPCAAQSTVKTDLLLDASIIYDSNFYFDADDEEGVTTYLLQPGVEVWLERPKSEIALHYNLNANYYDESGEDDFYGHTAFLLAAIEMTDRLSLELSNNFKYTRDSAQLDSLGNSADREKYYQNRLKPILSYHFEPKVTVNAGYQNWITDYRDNDEEDSTGHQGIFDLIYHLNRSASVGLEYHYWDMDYDGDTSDYTSNQLSFVARKEWMHTALEAGAGYQDREFDDSEIDDIDTVAYRFRLEGNSTSGKTRFSLTADQNFNNLNQSGEGYYKANRFSATTHYDLTERITAGVSGFYQNSDYKESRREDDTYNITGDISYLVKEWLVFNVAAGYETRDSDISSEEYDNTEVMARLQFAHSIGQ
jgi:hypothetical protein